jgi:hypothetical protein
MIIDRAGIAPTSRTRRPKRCFARDQRSRYGHRSGLNPNLDITIHQRRDGRDSDQDDEDDKGSEHAGL